MKYHCEECNKVKEVKFDPFTPKCSKCNNNMRIVIEYNTIDKAREEILTYIMENIPLEISRNAFIAQSNTTLSKDEKLFVMLRVAEKYARGQSRIENAIL